MEDKIQKTDKNLERGLENRHLWMYALGSAIGTGLFYGSAGALKTAGPSAILAYMMVGVLIFLIVRALGEMCVAEPVSGGVVAFGNRYLGRFFGFFMGWTALISCAATSTAGFNALGKYVQFWYPDVPIWVSAGLGMAFIIAINLLAVKVFGEVEFWSSSLKVTAILLMVIFGFAIILFGVGNNGVPLGFDNLVAHGGFFPNGVLGFLGALVLVGYAYMGTEDIGSAAAEAKNPEVTLPKAINSTAWRIIIFYVAAVFVLVTLFPWNQLGLQGSPFVLVFEKMGIPQAANLLNLVVITADISAINAGIYNASRKAYQLGLQGNGPSWFTKVTSQGSPYLAVLTVVGIELFGILMNYIVPEQAFIYFASIATLAAVVQWAAILICQMKFRKIKIAKDEEKSILYKMPFWPYSSYLALGLLMLIVLSMALDGESRIALIVMPFWLVIVYGLYRFYSKKSRCSNDNDDVLQQR